PEHMRAQFGRAAEGTPFAGDLSEARATADPPAKTTDEIHEEAAAKYSAGTPGQEIVKNPSAPVKAAHEEAVRRYPHLFTNDLTDVQKMRKQVGVEPPATPSVKRYQEAQVELQRLAQKQRDAGIPDAENKPLNRLK